MGIVEIIVAVTALVTAGGALYRELRGVKKLSRAQILSQAKKTAWEVVEGMKKEKPMTKEQMLKAFKDQVLKCIQHEGLKGFTLQEANALHESAEILSRAGKYLAKR